MIKFGDWIHDRTPAQLARKEREEAKRNAPKVKKEKKSRTFFIFWW